MLLDRDERRPNLPPDGARQYLPRPFSAADLGAVLARQPAELGVLENAIIDTWARHAARDPLPRPDGLAYRTSWRPSTRRRVGGWGASGAPAPPAGADLGGVGRRHDRPAGGVQPQRPERLWPRLHQLRRLGGRGVREPHPADLPAAVPGRRRVGRWVLHAGVR